MSEGRGSHVVRLATLHVPDVQSVWMKEVELAVSPPLDAALGRTAVNNKACPFCPRTDGLHANVVSSGGWRHNGHKS